MSENVYTSATGVNVIINGGDPLPGCPESWEQARAIEAAFNAGKEDGGIPKWKFDCGFKLDYDGPMLTVSSRFYPPKTHQGSTWDGSVTIYLMGEPWEERKFDCATIEELKQQVEEFISEVHGRLRK